VNTANGAPMSDQRAQQTTKSSELCSTTSQTKETASPELMQPGAALQRAHVAPSALTSSDVMALQRTIGNQAVQRLLSSNQTEPNPSPAGQIVIQPKLVVGPAQDRYEQEADNVAQQVMRMPVSARAVAQRDALKTQTKSQAPLKSPNPSITPLNMRQRRDDTKLQASSAAPGTVGMEGGPVGGDIESSIRRAKGGGKALSDTVRTKMEAGIGADFSNVRVHVGGQADTLNRSLNARAFTTGSDIFFKQGAYSPGSAGGQHLLAHELTHVVQQGGASSKRAQSSHAQTKRDPVTKPVGKSAHTVVQRSLEGFRNFFSATTAKVKAKLGTQKAGKTLDTLIDPAMPVTRAFRDYAVTKNATVDLDFLREYRTLFNPAAEDLPFDAVHAFLNKYNGVLAGLDYNTNSPLENAVRMRRIQGLHPAPTVVRRRSIEALLEGVVNTAQSRLRAVVNGYNSAHGRQAAPLNVSGPQPTDDQVFTQHGVAPTAYKTANIDPHQAPKALGSGAVNTVYKHKYTTDAKQQVFKGDSPINDFYGRDAGTQVGIPEQNPEFAKRSVAMYRLDQLLGANVLGATAFAVQDGEFGSVMELAEGDSYLDLVNKIGGAQKDLVVNDPAFQKALSKLQLLDIICGQLDRHTGNYIIQRDPGTGAFIALKGIDNDMAFGKDHTDITAKIGKGYTNTDQGYTLNNGVKMGGSTHISEVRLLDDSFIQTILGLDTSLISVALTGLLSPAEIAATITRTEQLQQYIRDVQSDSLANTLTQLNQPPAPGSDKMPRSLVAQYQHHKASGEWQEAFNILKGLRNRATRLEAAGKVDKIGQPDDLLNLSKEMSYVSQKLQLPDVVSDPFAGITAGSSAAEASPLWDHIEPQERLKRKGIDDKAVMYAIWDKGDDAVRQRLVAILKSTGDQLRMSHIGYILEALDPQHRMTLVDSAGTWFSSGATDNFFTWLASNAPSGNVQANYYDGTSRDRALIRFTGGTLQQKNDRDEIKPLQTDDGHGWIVVMSRNHEFYCKPKSEMSEALKTQHSSFMGGVPVESAGRLKAAGGKLTFVENYSGHYKPETRHLVKMLMGFQSMGVNIASVKVKDNDKLKNRDFTGPDYIDAASRNLKGI
jgi:hypothetical protein